MMKQELITLGDETWKSLPLQHRDEDPFSGGWVSDGVGGWVDPRSQMALALDEILRLREER